MLMWQSRSHCELAAFDLATSASVHMRLPRDAQRTPPASVRLPAEGCNTKQRYCLKFVSGANKDQRLITPRSLACA
jgi:hypothetical protein